VERLMTADFHDLAGVPRVAEDPIAQNELDALIRRVEGVEDRVEALQVQSGGNFAAVIEGQAALRREVRDGFTKVNARFDDLENKMDRNQAQIVELLTALVGKSPE
jgi:tetrahydromethanopterin S-methyltransferase subunit G